jgi:hypothetical protein
MTKTLMHLNFEEYPVWKAPHSSTSNAAVDDRELRRMFRNCVNCRLDCHRESRSKLEPNVVIPCPCF